MEDKFFFGFEEKPLNQTTLQKMDAIAAEAFKKRAEAEELEAKASELNKQVEALKAKLMNIMEATGRLKYDAPLS